METIKRKDIQERARGRALAIWSAWDLLGIAAPLGNLEDLLNQTHRHRSEQLFVVADRAADIHEDQHSRETGLQFAEVDQDERIAQARYETGIQKNAIRMAAEEYAIAGKLYEAKTKEMIQDARDYAAAIERELIELERTRAEMDVRKQQIELMRVNTQIQVEAVQHKMVEADVAKAWLEVAKAHLRELQAIYEADEAELKVVATDIQVVEAQVERSTIKADIASIFADIATRGLAEVQFSVENSALAAQFGFIAQKLTAMLTKWEIEGEISQVHTAAETSIVSIFGQLIAADTAEQQLHILQENAHAAALGFENGLLGGWKSAEANYLHAKYDSWYAVLMATTWGKAIVNAAKRAAKQTFKEDRWDGTHENQYISK